MNSTVFIESSHGNYYLYDFLKKEFMPCHPIIYVCYILDREDKLNNLLQYKNVNGITLKQAFGESTVEYYKSKYIFLKERNYFTTFFKEPFFPYTSQLLKETLSNIHNIVFEVTESCNLECAYCVYGHLYSNYDPRTNKKQNIETVKAVINYLEPFWSSNLNKSSHQNIMIGFYGGEPLMNFSLIRSSVDFLKKKETATRKFEYNMTTNATLLHHHIDFLVENEFNITISLDGSKQGQSYRIFREEKDNSFDKVFANLKMIQTKYPDFFKKHIFFNSVLHNRNSVAEIHDFIYKEFGKIPEIHSLNNTGVLPEKKKEFDNMFISYSQSIEEKGINLIQERFTSDHRLFNLSQFLLWYGNNEFYESESLLHSDYIKKRAKTGTCAPFQRKMYITAYNKILACERIGEHYVLGNIVNGKVCLNLDEIALKYNKYYNAIYKQCKDCYMINGCHQCIFQLRNLDTDMLVCNSYCDEKQITKYLKSHIDLLESQQFKYSKLFNEGTLI